MRALNSRIGIPLLFACLGCVSCEKRENTFNGPMGTNGQKYIDPTIGKILAQHPGSKLFGHGSGSDVFLLKLRSGRFAYCDPTGKILVEGDWDVADPFFGDYGEVVTRSGEHLLVDKTGRVFPVPRAGVGASLVDSNPAAAAPPPASPPSSTDEKPRP